MADLTVLPPSGFPPPPAPVPPRRSWLPLLAVVVVAAVTVAAIGAGSRLGSSDDDTTDGKADESESAAEVDEDELDALVEELSAFVEAERGLRFEEEVDLEVLDAEAYRERTRESVEETLAEDTEDLEATAGAFRALGFWPEDADDPADILREFTAVASLGFYDPVAQEMVVLGAADTPNLRVTLVHELTHALDDQHFDLGRLERLAERSDESSLAFRALVEGNASRVDAAYEATLSDEDQQSIVDEQLELLEGVDLGGIPPILFVQQEFVYSAGEAFVDSLLDAGGNAAVDDALRDPPTTSEQILEPEAWPDREPIVEVDVPEADGEPLEDGAVGQAFLAILVHGLFGAEDPVPEWDGDNSVVWADGDDFCARFAVAGDVEGYEEALDSWAERVDAELGVEDDLLVATSCG